MKRGKQLIVSLGAILILASLSWGQDSLNVTHLYQHQDWFWGDSYGLDISGNYAYVADEWAGLEVVDISNPENPQQVGHWSGGSGEYPTNIRISGSYAYVTMDFHGLRILDISHPEAPQLVGSFDTPGHCWDVAVVGTYAFIADGDPDLTILDISDPAHPALVATCNVPGGSQGLDASGNYVYLANYTYGLRIIDVSDPQAPVEVGFCENPGAGYGVTVSGSYAYLADGGPGGLRIIDVSDPSAPVETGSCGIPGMCEDVVIVGSLVYAAANNGGLWIINVSNPHAPFIVGGLDPGGHTKDIAVSGSHAFTVNSSIGLRVYDVSAPHTPVLVTTYCPRHYISDVAFFGNNPYVACAGHNFRVMDASDPSNLVEIGHLDSLADLIAVATSGSWAYVVSQLHFYTVNLSIPSQPQLVGSCALPYYINDVTISGSYAYVAADEYGMRIVDVSNPAAPVVVGSYDDLNGSVTGIAVSASYAYLADEWHSLIILDISHPSNPVPVGHWGKFGWHAGEIAVSGSYAFLTHYPYGLAVLDVSNPAVPTLASSWDSSASFQSLALSGSSLYLTTSQSSVLHVLDVSNPLLPVETGYYSSVWGTLEVWNSTIYAMQSSLLNVYAFSGPQLNLTLQPVNPPLMIPATGGSFQFNATIANPGTGSAPCYVWIMQQTPSQVWQGPMMGPLNLTLPAGGNITRLRTQTVPAIAEPGVYTYRGYVGVYHGAKWDSSGFTYTKLVTGNGPSVSGWACTEAPISSEVSAGSMPSTSNFKPCSPNPFNPSTAISYELRAASYVSLRVYDTTGRLVATLVNGWTPAGTHSATFDGSTLPSGLYFARLQAGDFTAVQKLVLMK